MGDEPWEQMGNGDAGSAESGAAIEGEPIGGVVVGGPCAALPFTRRFRLPTTLGGGG